MHSLNSGSTPKTEPNLCSAILGKRVQGTPPPLSNNNNSWCKHPHIHRRKSSLWDIPRSLTWERGQRQRGQLAQAPKYYSISIFPKAGRSRNVMAYDVVIEVDAVGVGHCDDVLSV